MARGGLDELIATVSARCAQAGFDLVQPLCVNWYNPQVAREHRLPDFGHHGALAVLVGNTRALWPCFVDWLARAPARIEQPDPLQDYVEAALSPALAVADHAHAVRWSHRPDPHHIAFQRLASASGLAQLTPSYLSVHRVHGPWLSLRAVAVYDRAGPDVRPRPVGVCGSCESHCMPALRRACATVRDAAPGHARVSRHWRLWLAVRDACPVGRASRFPASQIRYHYTKDRRILRRLVEARPTS